MKFLCLAYGDEEGWNSLSKDEQQEVLAQDEVIKARGTMMSALRPGATSVRNWTGAAEVSEGPYPQHRLPLAGFSVIEAASLDEVIALVSNSPCARARGVIDIRPLWDPGADD